MISDGKVAGVVYTQAGGEGIAWLRFDRSAGMTADGVSVQMLEAS